jgi:hypothetical protein
LRARSFCRLVFCREQNYPPKWGICYDAAKTHGMRHAYDEPGSSEYGFSPHQRSSTRSAAQAVPFRTRLSESSGHAGVD